LFKPFNRSAPFKTFGLNTAPRSSGLVKQSNRAVFYPSGVEVRLVEYHGSNLVVLIAISFALSLSLSLLDDIVSLEEDIDGDLRARCRSP
jgi:hypothetical protein